MDVEGKEMRRGKISIHIMKKTTKTKHIKFSRNEYISILKQRT
jgi:hypothetical protein